MEGASAPTSLQKFQASKPTLTLGLCIPGSPTADTRYPSEVASVGHSSRRRRRSGGGTSCNPKGPLIVSDNNYFLGAAALRMGRSQESGTPVPHEGRHGKWQKGDGSRLLFSMPGSDVSTATHSLFAVRETERERVICDCLEATLLPSSLFS